MCSTSSSWLSGSRCVSVVLVFEGAHVLVLLARSSGDRVLGRVSRWALLPQHHHGPQDDDKGPVAVLAVSSCELGMRCTCLSACTGGRDDARRAGGASPTATRVLFSFFPHEKCSSLFVRPFTTQQRPNLSTEKELKRNLQAAPANAWSFHPHFSRTHTPPFSNLPTPVLRTWVTRAAFLFSFG
jgi:hypothetical protein